MNQYPKIKICCISSVDEASMAIEFGALAIGLVGKMPSGPGVISDKKILEIARTVPPPIATFMLTSETSAEAIITHHEQTQTNTIQIVDSVSPKVYKHLREALPAIKLVQVVHVIDESSIKEAVEISSHVDAILLDSGNPALKVKVLGGTGKTHNWELSRKIREKVKVPVFLAGGLHAGNVKEAITSVQPFGIDICTGARTNGKLDTEKLKKIFEVAINRV